MADRAEPNPDTLHTGDPDPQLVFLEELVEEHATIAGDVIQLDAHTWAIHGSIAMDGEVLMAEYDSEAHARIVLDELSSLPRRPGRAGAPHRTA